MVEQNKKEAKKLAVEMLEREILRMKGTPREKAMRAYHRLLSALADEPMYLRRS